MTGTWRTPDEMTSGWMVRHAEHRGIVKLADGQQARLLCWKPKTNKQLVDIPAEGRRTVKKDQVQYVLDHHETREDRHTTRGDRTE